MPPPSNASLQHGYREYRNSDGNNGWGSPTAFFKPLESRLRDAFISSLYPILIAENDIPADDLSTNHVTIKFG